MFPPHMGTKYQYITNININNGSHFISYHTRHAVRDEIFSRAFLARKKSEKQNRSQALMYLRWFCGD